jgi:hypothetical protein
VLKASKYPSARNSSGPSESLVIAIPQFEIHPPVPDAAVPGLPVVDSVSVQNSGVIPHSPQTSQHALRGQGFNPAQKAYSVPFAVVPGICGPHTAFSTADGNGGSPVLRQMFSPA